MSKIEKDLVDLEKEKKFRESQLNAQVSLRESIENNEDVSQNEEKLSLTGIDANFIRTRLVYYFEGEIDFETLGEKEVDSKNFVSVVKELTKIPEDEVKRLILLIKKDFLIHDNYRFLEEGYSKRKRALKQHIKDIKAKLEDLLKYEAKFTRIKDKITVFKEKKNIQTDPIEKIRVVEGIKAEIGCLEVCYKDFYRKAESEIALLKEGIVNYKEIMKNFLKSDLSKAKFIIGEPDEKAKMQKYLTKNRMNSLEVPVYWRFNTKAEFNWDKDPEEMGFEQGKAKFTDKYVILTGENVRMIQIESVSRGIVKKKTMDRLKEEKGLLAYELRLIEGKSIEILFLEALDFKKSVNLVSSVLRRKHDY